MKPLAIDEIRRAVRGEWLRAGEPVTVTAVSTDSRTVGPGELFVAVPGERFDGHDFVPQAADAGAAAAIVCKGWQPPAGSDPAPPGGIIAVDDTIRALGDLGAYHRGLCKAKVVAVTGSNGKTTVKRMIHHILSRRLTGTCSPKSFNNRIGVPLALLGARLGDDYVVCEVGSNAPGEIASLGRICRPNVAVITSVHPVHLEGLGTVDGVAVEKASLLGELQADGLAVVCGDVAPAAGGRALAQALRAHGRPTIRFGASEDCQVRLTDYRPQDGGCRFEVNGRLWVALAVPGRHNALNALAAMTVARRFASSLEQAAEALADFAGVAMRTECIVVGAVTIVNDAYNANPASMAAAADVLAERPAGRRVMVAGDMLELGPQSQWLHLQTGREIAARKLDLLIGVGPMGRYIAQGAAADGLRAETFGSVEQAISALPAMLQAGDVVLVKGSRSMGMERLVGPLQSAFANPPEGGTKKGPAR